MLHLALLCCIPGQTVESADFPDAVQRTVLAASVRVIAEGESQNTGTGVVIKQKGAFIYVLTAAHIVAKAKRLEVQAFTMKSYPDPANTTREVELIASAPEQDLAVLRLPAGKITVTALPLAVRGTAPKEARFAVLTVGCDKGQAPGCLADEVRGKKLLAKSKDGKETAGFFWECSKGPTVGRSGGPLIDVKGRLLGICSGTQDNRGYYTHLAEIHAALKREGLAWLAEAQEPVKDR